MSHAAREQDAEPLTAVTCGEDPALTEDALDARAALAAATKLAERLRSPWSDHEDWLRLADRAYRWLRGRETLRPVSVSIVPGNTYPEGKPVATTFDLSDTSEVPFTLVFGDGKVAVPAPAGFTASWTLADPDSTGAVLTPSADGTSAVLSAGVPDSNLLVSVAVSFPDPSGSGDTITLNGAEAVIVQSGPAQTVTITPGTPTPEGQ